MGKLPQFSFPGDGDLDVVPTDVDDEHSHELSPDAHIPSESAHPEAADTSTWPSAGAERSRCLALGCKKSANGLGTGIAYGSA